MDNYFTQPPAYEPTVQRLNFIKARNPEVKLFSVGKSVLGRKIYAVAIGNTKNATLFVGGVHAGEWLTCSLLVRFFTTLAEHYTHRQPLLDTDLRAILREKGLICVPMVNPDGIELVLGGVAAANGICPRLKKLLEKSETLWQANAHGVDLNHNFDAGFAEAKRLEAAAGIVAPGATRYGGKAPHSEPETRALVNLCRAFDVKKVVAFHSQGEEIYYEYGEHTPPVSRLMAELLASSCGYRLVKNSGLSAHGGFKDWFIDKTHRPGFTVEIGRGKNPLPIQDLEPIYARLLEMMLIAIML